MYYYTHRSTGLLLIILGVLLLLFAANDFLWRILLIFFSVSLINRGLRLRGLPSLQFMLHSWFNILRF